MFGIQSFPYDAVNFCIVLYRSGAKARGIPADTKKGKGATIVSRSRRKHVTHAATASEAICLYDEDVQVIDDLGCYDAIPSSPYHNQSCLFSTHTPRLRVLAWLMEPGQVMTRVIGDLVRAWDLIAIGALISFAAISLCLLVLHCGVI